MNIPNPTGGQLTEDWQMSPYHFCLTFLVNERIERPHAPLHTGDFIAYDIAREQEEGVFEMNKVTVFGIWRNMQAEFNAVEIGVNA